MAQDRFDVTFIRGPRDVSPWRRAAREMTLGTRLQTEEAALQARSGYREQRDEIHTEKFPNATYFRKGRNSK
ncbi:hypothetical protein EV586_101818 [Tumebacillus sp. BK434]|uniref:hypothetical protein n=1 Tax=Tumebacillus sp. BK434 TaxID=2512169 RepID=UPI001052EF76|nr:hypothetical protein [Tumebacillus sp. BK434]TCP59589.1 hypothetical protein EV586_101818 [Tumebacillus sp. BK434]